MKFSVIIPLYNKAPYAAKAIGSVLSQTFTDYELVIVDDGSSDNSAEVAGQAIEGHKSCRLIIQENAGVGMARNNGVSVSRGDYFCFLDADDWWEPTFLEEMAKLIDEYPDAGIYGTGYTIVNETKHRTRVASIGVEEGFERGYINYCQVYAKTMYMPLTSISVAIPRQVFEQMKGFPAGILLGEDFLLWIHIALQYKVAFLNKSLAYYNQDVNKNSRGVGKLYPPERHMLWNLTDLEPQEKTNLDYKQLVDELRTSGLMPHFLSKEYHEAAQRELAKVDWSKQPAGIKREYKRPIGLLKLKYTLMRIGSIIKHKLISCSNGKENPN
jgi:glycosyltransferase involved in cell wall biosynthesis